MIANFFNSQILQILRYHRISNFANNKFGSSILENYKITIKLNTSPIILQQSYHVINWGSIWKSRTKCLFK